MNPDCIFTCPQDSSTMLYYFFSTYAQSLAALLALLVSVYVFAKSLFGRECKEIIAEMARVVSGSPTTTTTDSFEEAIRHAEYFIGSGDANARAGAKEVLTDQIRHLKEAKKNLDNGVRLGRAFPWLFAGVFAAIAAIPFVPLISKACILVYVVPGGFLLLLARIGESIWDGSKEIFNDALIE